ncbi:MAG: ATP-binding protein [Bacteroidales bacterium]|nr:ATP-binding protein [Bacteroidales bacterium]
MITRITGAKILLRLKDKKAIILLGPRQTGKTTLLHQLFDDKSNILWWNGDETDLRSQLENVTSTRLQSMIGNYKTLIIDEAQRIKNIGLCIKLITDNIKNVKVIATGSSAFGLANKINEPLTGRKWEFMLYPFSYKEMLQYHGQIEEQRLLEHRIIYGYYPDVVNNPGDEITILKTIVNSYLYKDILTWERIQKPDRLEKLVQALAFQIGNEISYNELGQLCGLDNETVEKYILLLERAFIVFRLSSLRRNLRNELKKSRKIYFYDNGLRNSIINQFNPVGLRNDVGALWENFIISERMKFIEYEQFYLTRYFWRTKEQQEIDYIEEYNGKMFAYEFKWNKIKNKFPITFLKAYPDSKTSVITKDNYQDFIISH